MNDKTKFSKEYLEIEQIKSDIERNTNEVALKIKELDQKQAYYRSVGFWRNIIIVFIGCMAATATITAAIVKGVS